MSSDITIGRLFPTISYNGKDWELRWWEHGYQHTSLYLTEEAVKQGAKDLGFIEQEPAPSETRVTDPETGGAKGKKPEEYALIPVEALAEVARVYGYGAEKYDPHNWRRGYDWSLSYSALQRHVNQFWSGQSLDPESGLHHLAHAAFHLFSLMTFDNLDGEEVPVYTQKDDRYRR